VNWSVSEPLGEVDIVRAGLLLKADRLLGEDRNDTELHRLCTSPE
jgi:hypothetical protein